MYWNISKGIQKIAVLYIVQRGKMLTHYMNCFPAGGDSRDKISCRYGERFIEAIALILDENPDSATSITDRKSVV